jgi:hypothetical protein
LQAETTLVRRSFAPPEHAARAARRTLLARRSAAAAASSTVDDASAAKASLAAPQLSDVGRALFAVFARYGCAIARAASGDVI